MDVPALPKGINAEFREYQKRGFGWLWFMYQYGLNGILADDMGLGKTLQALALLQKAKEKNKKAPNLVVCPTSVVFNWENEIEKFAPGLSCLKLSGTERKDLFKEILNAMGYIAERTKKGADRGVDIFASKDGLGLEEPRIFVEVKHRNEQMGAQDIRTFIGGRQPSDKCLYVSTGGFTKEARYEAERSNTPLKLIDIDDLANLLSLHYDKFSAEGKTLLPLKKVYIPLN